MLNCSMLLHQQRQMSVYDSMMTSGGGGGAGLHITLECQWHESPPARTTPQLRLDNIDI